MKKKIFIIILIMAFCFVPIKTYAYNESDSFSSMSSSDLMDYFYSFVNPSFDKFICFTAVNSSNFICYVGNSTNVLTIDNSSTRWYVRYFVNGSVVADQWGNVFSPLALSVAKNQTPSYARTPSTSSPSLNSSNTSSYFSNTDVLDQDGNLAFAKTMDYTPSVVGCPECEECEICTNTAGVDISKEEFYVLLLLISIIVCTNFLRWCFPFKRGADIK